MANTNLMNNANKLNLLKYKYLWLSLTGILLIPCIIAILYLMITQPNHAPLKLGIDFTGGTILQYSTEKKLDTSDIKDIRVGLEALQVKNPVIQTTSQGQETDSLNLVSIRTTFLGDKEGAKKVDEITQKINSMYSGVQLVQVSSIGPSLGTELLKNTMTALILAFIMMVIYISFRFRVEYGWIALLTLFQDVIFVVGVFAIKGIFFDTTIDSLLKPQ